MAAESVSKLRKLARKAASWRTWRISAPALREWRAGIFSKQLSIIGAASGNKGEEIEMAASTKIEIKRQQAKAARNEGVIGDGEKSKYENIWQ